MKRRPITTILILIGLGFAAMMVYFYIQEGSMEGAGARMDETLQDAGEAVGEAAKETGEAAGDLVEDIADGPDDE